MATPARRTALDYVGLASLGIDGAASARSHRKTVSGGTLRGSTDPGGSVGGDGVALATASSASVATIACSAIAFVLVHVGHADICTTIKIETCHPLSCFNSER